MPHYPFCPHPPLHSHNAESPGPSKAERSRLAVSVHPPSIGKMAAVSTSVIASATHSQLTHRLGSTQRDGSSATSGESATRAPTSLSSRSRVSTARRLPALTSARLVYSLVVWCVSGVCWVSAGMIDVENLELEDGDSGVVHGWRNLEIRDCTGIRNLNMEEHITYLHTTPPPSFLSNPTNPSASPTSTRLSGKSTAQRSASSGAVSPAHTATRVSSRASSASTSPPRSSERRAAWCVSVVDGQGEY